MAQIYNASIDLAMIDKSEIYTTADGKKFLTLRLVFNRDEADQYGTVGFVAQRMSKEKQEAHAKKGIVGSIKIRIGQTKQQADDDSAPF